MNLLYPLKFKPQFVQKIWGGTRLIKTYNTANKYENIGEAWLLSAVENFESIVENGFLKGNTINELSEVYMEDLLGENVFNQFGSEFPLLIKIIDTSDLLSIQVHPDDDLAQKKHHLPNGKTEMWYVISADEDAEIISGFNERCDRLKFKNAIQNNTIDTLLKSYKVKKGDVFFTPAGMIHAIGANITLAEIQQSSNITYRLWDWGRKNEDGTYRELHLEDGLDALKYEMEEGGKMEYNIPKNGSSNLVSTPQFTTNIIKLDKGVLLKKDLFPIDSFVAYLCTEGSASFITEQSNAESVLAGELILIPAAFNDLQILVAEDSILLEIYISG